jgi:hypothetical protein
MSINAEAARKPDRLKSAIDFSHMESPCYFRASIKVEIYLIPEVKRMCRNIRTLFNFEPPVNQEEIRAASLQFVRKISGFNKPSKANETIFAAAVEEIAAVSARLLRSLETTAPPKNRADEAAKAKARSAERYGTRPGL